MGLKLYEKKTMLGASVDGILCCECHPDDVIMEIKCPFSLKDTSICKEGYKLPYLNNDLKLKTTHPYYSQVQFGMGVYDINKALFIVWSKVDFVVNEISFDRDFFDQLVHNVSSYYELQYLPNFF